MRQTDYPDIKPVAEIGPEEHIAGLYGALGWERGSELDPAKIVINDQRWLDECQQYIRFSKEENAGFLWMNIGPTTDSKVPYDKIRIEDGAFHEVSRAPVVEAPRPELDTAAVDKFMRETFYLGRGDDNVIQLNCDSGRIDDYYLRAAYAHRHEDSGHFNHSMHLVIEDDWAEPTDMAAEYLLHDSGLFPPDAGELCWKALEYVRDNYVFRPPYEEILEQPVRMNLILGMPEEIDRDFSSIQDMVQLDDGERIDAIESGNGLAWLIGQQGYGLGDLAEVLMESTSSPARKTLLESPFLSSTASEISSFSHAMGAVTVLAEMPMKDIARLNDPGTGIVVPRDARVGLFAPWVGGGSLFGIELEKDVSIPSSMVFEAQIEGAPCETYSVGSVYGFSPESWTPAKGIEREIPEPRLPGAYLASEESHRGKTIEELRNEAKDKAAEKNATHLETKGKHRASREFDR